MNNKHPEQIPDVIFDWIDSYAFETLSVSMQEEVLRHFTAEEYKDLYQASRDIRAVKQAPVVPGYVSRKEQLLQQFDRKHNLSRKRSFPAPIVWWRAAAILLFVSTGCLGYYAASHRHSLSDAMATTIDTLYITKEIASAPVRIMDTIFIGPETTQGNKRRQRATGTKAAERQRMFPVADMDNIGVVSMHKLEEVENTPKGNSMKDDTLNKIFSFISL